MQNADWDIFRLIIAVADKGSAVAAADVLGVNSSTVLRRIARFEDANGVRLFDRHQSGYKPTLQGAAVVETARQIEQQINDIFLDILGSDLRLEGTVQVTTTDTFLEVLLAPLLPLFRAAHPEIAVEITVTNDRLNLTRHDADVALRGSRTPPETLVGQCISDVGFAVYGAEHLLAGIDGPVTLNNCSDLPWVGTGEALAGAPVGKWLQQNVQPSRIAVTGDTFPTIRSCAGTGSGLAVLPCCLGDAADDLVRVCPPIEEMKTSLWLLSHRGYHKSARVRAFIDFVAPALRARRSDLSGFPQTDNSA